MTYTRIRKALEKEYNETAQRRKNIIKKSDDGLRNWSTATRWEQFKSGKLTRREAEDKAITRMLKELDKQKQAELQQIETAENTPATEYIYICVEWKKSRTWGYCPTATITTDKGIYTAHASGCGYDKESAAIANALNDAPEVLTILYKYANKQNHYKLPYGSGYRERKPYFEGGTGINCFRSIFENCGYKWIYGGGSSTSDHYYIERRG